MAGTTRQIFDTLQAGGIQSQTPVKIDYTGNALKLVQTNWDTLYNGSGVNGQAYLQSKGFTPAYMATVTDTNFTGALSQSLATTKTLSAQSEKEFSPRMMVCDSYKAAKERLQDTAQPLGAAIYEKMFNIHSQAFLTKFDPVTSRIATVNSAIQKLQTMLTAHPVPAPVPPATVPAVDISVETAATSLKGQTDILVGLLGTLKSNADATNASEPGTMTEYLKYISNANLAKVLPDWHKDSNKTSTITELASPALIALI